MQKIKTLPQNFQKITMQSIEFPILHNPRFKGSNNFAQITKNSNSYDEDKIIYLRNIHSAQKKNDQLRYCSPKMTSYYSPKISKKCEKGKTSKYTKMEARLTKEEQNNQLHQRQMFHLCAEGPKDNLIHILQNKIKIMRCNIQKSSKQKKQKFKGYQSQIITEIKKNSVLKDNIIQTLKEKLNEQQLEIKYLTEEKIELTEALKNANNLLSECQQKLQLHEMRSKQLFKDYQNTISEKQQTIKKMSLFNDQLCLKLISIQQQAQFSSKNSGFQNKYQCRQKSTEKTLKNKIKLHLFPTPNVETQFWDHFQLNSQKQHTYDVSIYQKQSQKKQEKQISINTSKLDSMFYTNN